MRRRSERKKSTEVVSPSPVLKRSKRTRRFSSEVETLVKTKSRTEDTTTKNEVENESKTKCSAPESGNIDDLAEKNTLLVLPPEEEQTKHKLIEELETIAEVPSENREEIQNDSNKDISEIALFKDQEPNKALENTENKTKSKKNNEERTLTQICPEEPTYASQENIDFSKTDVRSPANVCINHNMADTEEGEVSEISTESGTELKRQKYQEKTEIPINSPEVNNTFSHAKERRAQIVLRKKKQENDENDNLNNKSEKLFTPSSEKSKNTRKRRWLSKRTSDSTSQILAISTDSLKNLISDVHPVPLSDIKLDSSSDVEEVESEREEGEASPTPIKLRTEKPSVFDKERPSKTFEKPTRQISLLNDRHDHLPLIPTKNEPSCVLYITNLVRPFTIFQLKGLLARTGKIVENRFWIDKIKSKCFVQYETEDEAIETRHALHGVRWPTSNPKCLNVDFGSAADMDKAMALSKDTGPQFGHEMSRENRIVGIGWDRDRLDLEEHKVGKPVREWDVGKKNELDIEAERARKREKMRAGERGERVIHNDRVQKEIIRNDERNDNERDRKQRSSDRERHRSMSVSPARKIKKKSNDPPLRLLDDLFRKTKTTPCIYWLPLTPEQIAEKEAFRLRRVAEHQERIRQREYEKGKDRERERERDKERRRERDRSNGHRRTNSRDRRRY